MGQLKNAEVDAFLARKPALPPVVLVYGPDRGLASERARRCAELSGAALDDPFAVVRLEAAEIERDPGRLADEAHTVPMFGGRRLIWIRNAGAQKALAETLRALCADPPRDAALVVEAGDLKKGAALRAVVEDAPSGLAIPCYADDRRLLDGVIDSELAAFGLAIDPAAREMLRDNLGGDRLASRMEVAKLALYAMNDGTVDADAVMLLTGDVSGASADAVVQAAMDGDGAAFDRLFGRGLAAGATAGTILSSAIRQLQQLHLLRGQMEKARAGAASVLSAVRPPLFGPRRAAFEAALQRWDSPALAAMLDRLQDTVLETRRRPDLAAALARGAMLGLAREARRRSR